MLIFSFISKFIKFFSCIRQLGVFINAGSIKLARGVSDTRVIVYIQRAEIIDMCAQSPFFSGSHVRVGRKCLAAVAMDGTVGSVASGVCGGSARMCKSNYSRISSVRGGSFGNAHGSCQSPRVMFIYPAGLATLATIRAIAGTKPPFSHLKVP